LEIAHLVKLCRGICAVVNFMGNLGRNFLGWWMSLMIEAIWQSQA
jgi:enoyl reductase-like protein